VRWLIPVMLPDDAFRDTEQRMAELVSQVNEQLRDHQLMLNITLHPIKLVPKVSDLPVFFDYSLTNDMLEILTSGERYDLISLPINNMQVTRLIDEGCLTDISGQVALYPNLAKMTRMLDMKGMQYKNGLYGMPAGMDMTGNILRSYLSVRADHDLASDSNGITDMPTLLSAADAAESLEKPHDIFFSLTPEAYRRTYDEFPFIVSLDYLFLFTQDGGVESYYESSVAQRDIDTAKRIDARHGADAEVFLLDSFPSEPEAVFARPFSRSLSTEDFVPIKLAPEKPTILYREPFGKVLNVIPAGSSALSGLEWLNVLYSDPDIYALFKDEAWLIDHEELRPLPLTSRSEAWATQEDGTVTSDSQLLPFFFTLYDCVRTPTMEIDVGIAGIDEDRDFYAYQPMPWDGFVFDPTPIQAVYNSVQRASLGAATEVSYLSIFVGKITVPWELNEIIGRMKTAGLDAVVEECRRQYAEFLQNKGWTAPAPSN